MAAVTMLINPPQLHRVDNRPELVPQVLDRWAEATDDEFVLSQPGKLTDNADFEAFNGRLRRECLNTHWFLLPEAVRAGIEGLRRA